MCFSVNRLQQAALGETGELRTTDYDVVIDGYSKDDARLLQLLRDRKILVARLGIAAGVIVNKNDARGLFFECFRKALARVDQ